jgi:hypothetical protein
LIGRCAADIFLFLIGRAFGCERGRRESRMQADEEAGNQDAKSEWMSLAAAVHTFCSI